MTFSQVAGTSIVPTLARLVLGFCFVVIGWSRMTEQVEFKGEQAMRLQALGVTVTARPAEATDNEGEPTDPAAPASGDDAGDAGGPVSLGDMPRRVVPAAFRQEADSEVQQQQEGQQPPPEQEGQAPPPQQQPPPEQEGQTPPPAEQAPPTGENQAAPPAQAAAEADPNMIYTAARMHRITLALDSRQVPGKYSKLIAPAVALTEMIGGGLLLIGLFSRLWAFALVVAMSAAIYFVTLPFIANVGNPLSLALEENMDQFNRMARHMGFLVLALLVMLAGPGPVSLDRLLFRREPAEPDSIEID